MRYRKRIVYGVVMIVFLSLLIINQKNMTQIDESFILLSSQKEQGMKEAAAFIEIRGGR